MFILFVGFSLSQQIPLVNHNFLNSFTFNPAAAGLNENTRAFLIRNERFKSFGNGLINNYLTVDGFNESWNSGFGLELYQQNFGIQKQLGFSGAYAYRLNLSKSINHQLRFGVKIGATDFSIHDNDIFLFQAQDPFVSQLNQQKLTLNGSAGLHYTLHGLNLDFAVPQLLGNKVKYSDTTGRGFYQMERHFLTQIIYKFNPILNQSLFISPSAMVRYAPNIPIQYEIGTTLTYKDFAWIRGVYKSDYAMEFCAGIKIAKAFTVGYAYELPIAPGKNFIPNNGHEFLLGFEFGNKNKTVVKDDITEVINRDTIQVDRINVVEIEDDTQEQKIKELLAENLKQKLMNDSLQIALSNTQRDTVINYVNNNEEYLQTLQNQQSTIDSLMRSVQNMNKSINNLASSNQKLSKTVAIQSKTIDSLSNADRPVKPLNDNSQELEARIRTLERSNLEKQTTIDSLQLLLYSLENDLANAKRKKEKKNKSNGNTITKVTYEDLNQRLAAKKTIDSLTLIANSKQSQIDNLMEENLTQTLEIDSLELLVRRLDAESYKKRDSIFNLKQELAQAQRLEDDNPTEIRNLKNKIVEENTDGFLTQQQTNKIIKDNQGKVQNSTLKDYFIELTGVDSPKGTYIVIGAYQDIKRAKNVLKDAKNDYEETRVIFNKRNSLNYVIVMYSVNLSKTVSEVGNTQRLGYDRAWVLNYDKE